MGRKVHPIGFRLKIIRDWDARWYAERKRYRDLLLEDFAIRRHIGNQGSRAAISRVEIERYPNQLLINIHTARPGIVIGRKGEAVKQLRGALEKLADGKKVKVEVSEIDKPDTDAKLVAENISGQLERRIGPQPRHQARYWPGHAPGRAGHSYRGQRPPRRLRHGPARMAVRGPHPAQHPARGRGLRHGRGPDDLRPYRREGLGLQR